MQYIGARHGLDLLIEIIIHILQLLPSWQRKQLSGISRRIRVKCLLSVFQFVRFKFSRSGLRELRNLADLEIRHHVVSFTYVVPELLKPDERSFYKTSDS